MPRRPSLVALMPLSRMEQNYAISNDRNKNAMETNGWTDYEIIALGNWR